MTTDMSGTLAYVHNVIHLWDIQCRIMCTHFMQKDTTNLAEPAKHMILLPRETEAVASTKKA